MWKLKNIMQPKDGDKWNATSYPADKVGIDTAGESHQVVFREEIDPLPDGTRRRRVTSSRFGGGVVDEKGNSWW